MVRRENRPAESLGKKVSSITATNIIMLATIFIIVYAIIFVSVVSLLVLRHAISFAKCSCN